MNPRTSALALAVVLAAAWTAAPNAHAHSAIEPVPRPDEWWKRRHENMNKKVETLKEKAQVIFIGDSITQGWEQAGREIWEKRYDPLNAINLGIGGDRTQHVLWRLDNGNLKGLKPKAAVVMIGTNNSNGEDNSVSQIADGIAAIVSKLRSSLPETRVLLIPIFPRSENPSPQRGKILQVNQIIHKLADGKDVVWVDFGHKFVRKDGTIPRELMPDFLHLSPEGYAVWADSLEPYLSAALGDSRETAGSTPNISGDWIATVPGPNDQPVDIPFTLRQAGNQLTGEFQRFTSGAPMKVEKGRLEGDRISWVLKRDREDGSVMTYEMTGKVEGTRLAGAASTTIEGNPVTISWTARRK